MASLTLPQTAQLAAQALCRKSATLATAESCTGGLVAHTLTNISGSSTFFKTGIIAYANEIKTGLLKVSPTLIKHHGAVSAPVARAMAQGARKAAKADYAVSLSGIAGPSGGTPQKPVGLVFIGIASARRTHVRKFIFQGTRLQIKTQAARAALSILCKEIS